MYPTKKIILYEKETWLFNQGVRPSSFEDAAVSLLIYSSSIAQYIEGLKNPGDKP